MGDNRDKRLRTNERKGINNKRSDKGFRLKQGYPLHFRFMFNIDVSLDTTFQTTQDDIENSLHHGSWGSPIALHFKLVWNIWPPQDHDSAKFNDEGIQVVGQ